MKGSTVPPTVKNSREELFARLQPTSSSFYKRRFTLHVGRSRIMECGRSVVVLQVDRRWKCVVISWIFLRLRLARWKFRLDDELTIRHCILLACLMLPKNHVVEFRVRRPSAWGDRRRWLPIFGSVPWVFRVQIMSSRCCHVIHARSLSMINVHHDQQEFTVPSSAQVRFE